MGDPGLAAADTGVWQARVKPLHHNRQASTGVTGPQAKVLTALSRQLYSPGCHRAALASTSGGENVVESDNKAPLGLR